MKVTIKDVAKKAGVSVTTVSFVLNGRLREVSEETAKTVLKTVKELGYVPNTRARNLQRQRSGFIALLVPDLANPFYTALAQAIMMELEDSEFLLALINSSGRLTSEENIYKLFASNTFDGGLIVSKKFDLEKYYPNLINTMPFVLLDESVDNEDIYVVTGNNIKGGVLAAEHLIEMGHTRLACITGPNDSPNSNKRLKGFLDECAKSGIEVDKENILEGDYTFESGYSSAMELIKRQNDITAVFCFNDLMALGAMRAFREMKISIPDDISIIGYDNSLYAQTSYESLTSIDQCVQDIGKKAIHILLNMIEKKDIKAKKIFIEPHLVKRDTVKRRII